MQKICTVEPKSHIQQPLHGKNPLLNMYPALIGPESEMYEHEQVEGIKARVLDSEKKATRKFGDFLCNASDLMEKMKVRLHKLKLTWKAYRRGEISEEASKAIDITSFLTAISESQGPYEYGDLSALLEKFCGEKGKKLVAEYEEGLKRQLSDRVEQEGKKFKVKVDNDLNWTNVLAFRITLAKLFNCAHEDFRLVDIRQGCTELTFIIPSEVADSILALITVSVEEFKNAKILQLTLEG